MFITKVKLKIGKMIIKYAPLNKLRVMGLKICGFEIGQLVYIGEDCKFIMSSDDRNSKLIIGNRVSISPGVTFILSSHPNHSVLKNNYSRRGSIIIGNDCWIGVNAIIYPQINIGKNSIILASAVVTKDISDGSIVAGIPAKVKENINVI